MTNLTGPIAPAAGIFEESCLLPPGFGLHHRHPANAVQLRLEWDYAAGDYGFRLIIGAKVMAALGWPPQCGSRDLAVGYSDDRHADALRKMVIIRTARQQELPLPDKCQSPGHFKSDVILSIPSWNYPDPYEADHEWRTVPHHVDGGRLIVDLGAFHDAVTVKPVAAPQQSNRIKRTSMRAIGLWLTLPLAVLVIATICTLHQATHDHPAAQTVKVSPP